MKYLLDTNTWIAALRWQKPEVVAHLKQQSSDDIVLCSMVLAELWFGAERSDPSRRADNLKRVDELAARYESLPFDNAASRDYAAIRAQLTAIGQPIGPNDLIIAAIARSRGVTLVTNNSAEFNRVPGLTNVSWLS